MSATLKIDNYGSLNLKESTQLDADYAAGINAFTLKSTLNYQANDFVILGQLGAEGCELMTIQSVAAQVATMTANSKLLHKRFDAFTSLFGNQINVYRAINVDGTQPLDGAFTLLTTVAIDPDQNYTTYTDAGGGSNYWYKFTYTNSISAAETSLADSMAARGGGYGHYTTVDDIRREAGFTNNANITDAVINSRRIDAEDEINSELTGIYTVPFGSPAPRVINNITKLLAAGYLLLAEYGAVTTGSNKEGNAKITEARGMLDSLKSRKLLLTDASGNSMAVSAAVTSWPDATTAGLSEYNSDGTLAHGGDNKFRIAHKF